MGETNCFSARGHKALQPLVNLLSPASSGMTGSPCWALLLHPQGTSSFSNSAKLPLIPPLPPTSHVLINTSTISIIRNVFSLRTYPPFIFKTLTFSALSQLCLQGGVSTAPDSLWLPAATCAQSVCPPSRGLFLPTRLPSSHMHLRSCATPPYWALSQPRHLQAILPSTKATAPSGSAGQTASEPASLGGASRSGPAISTLTCLRTRCSLTPKPQSVCTETAPRTAGRG